MYDRNNLEWHKESTIEVFAIIKSLFLKEWISCIAKFRMPDITKASTSLLEQTGIFFKRWEYQTTWPASWETYMQVRKQQLELDMEQQTGSK